MKKILLFCTLSLIVSCYQTERNCNDFRTGKFYSESVVNDVVYKSRFIRTEQLQIETYDNHTDSSEIRWINDCEVIFRTINPKNMAEQKDIHLKILQTTDSSYTFEYSYVGEVKKAKGTVYKVE
ncbi:DNA topoisomerase IV [Hyunsoonleella flava]|uniref:DNA topoisomerase IV n=1 Tax=Hyunsoonleella flava TaxID=2527939 RepID=A0A4Q9FHF5_9FLAO|nr:DNA topoisomerase IV [Hyunsoonleella flava]TBN06498.1 DNA topoisomerase IV [Hyunsoonleella flava]